MEDQVYEAHCETLLDLARQTKAGASSMLIIGHSPGVQDLALMLAAAPDGDTDAGLLQRAAAKFPLPRSRSWCSPAPGRGSARAGLS